MPARYLSIGAFAVLYSVVSWLVTRGDDGSLFLAVTMIPGIGIIYGLSMRIRRVKQLAVVLRHCLLFEVAAVLGMIVSPTLTGMGGMLYMMIPVFVVVGIAVGLAAHYLVFRIMNPQRRP